MGTALENQGEINGVSLEGKLVPSIGWRTAASSGLR
jgi:hypothetical protein